MLSKLTTKSKEYVYIDESGSLSGTEFYFVVAAVFSQSPKSLKHITKRLRRKMGQKKLKQTPELKFHTSNEPTRRRLLTMLARKKVNFLALLVNKEGRRVKDSPEAKTEVKKVWWTKLKEKALAPRGSVDST